MILDNLKVHFVERVRDFEQSENVEFVYNSVDSSNYNPLERLFATTKRIVRKKLI